MYTYLSLIWEYLLTILGVISALSVVVEFAPIKVHPLSSITRKLGKALTKDLRDEISNVSVKMNELSTTLATTEDNLNKRIDANQRESTERYIKQLRKEILDFSNSCMHGVHHTVDEFEHIIDAHTEYEELIEKLKLKNGRVKMEFDYIQEVYRQACINNSFIKGEDFDFKKTKQ